MWTRSYSKVFKGIKKEAIWQRWTDVNRWNEWVPNVESCKLEKPFVTGSSFILKPKASPAVTVKLLNVRKEQTFTGCTRFFGATLYDIHEIHQDSSGLRLTVTLKVTGPLGFLWRKLVAEKIESNLPTLLKNLASVAGSPQSTTPTLISRPATPPYSKPDLQLISSGTQKQKTKAKITKKKPHSIISTTALKKGNPLIQSSSTESEISNGKVENMLSSFTKPKAIASKPAPKKAKSKTSSVKKSPAKKTAAKKTTAKKTVAKKSTAKKKTTSLKSKAKSRTTTAKKRTSSSTKRKTSLKSKKTGTRSFSKAKTSASGLSKTKSRKTTKSKAKPKTKAKL